MQTYEKAFSEKEIISYLHISKSTLDFLIKKRHIPYKVTSKAKYEFDRQEIRHWQSHRLITDTTLDKYSLVKEAYQVNKNLQDFSLLEFLTPQTVFLDMNANSPSSLFRKLATQAYELGYVDDKKRFYDQLIHREKQSSTALGDGIALPHTRYYDQFLVLEPFIFVVVTQRALPFKAYDGKLVDLFFLPAVCDDTLHCYTIAKISTLLNSTALAEQIRQAETNTQVIKAIEHYQEQLKKKCQ